MPTCCRGREDYVYTTRYSEDVDVSDRSVPVTGRHPAPPIPFSSVLPNSPPTCNASYTPGRCGQCSRMFEFPLEDEVGELRLPTYQLLLTSGIRHPFECCTMCGNQSHHARHVTNHDRRRHCSVEEAGGRSVLCWRCLA